MTTTAEYFVQTCRNSIRKSITRTKCGWLISFYDNEDEPPVHVSVVDSRDFLIMLPIGNKINQEFFPLEERTLLSNFFDETISELSDGTNR